LSHSIAPVWFFEMEVLLTFLLFLSGQTLNWDPFPPTCTLGSQAYTTRPGTINDNFFILKPLGRGPLHMLHHCVSFSVHSLPSIHYFQSQICLLLIVSLFQNLIQWGYTVCSLLKLTPCTQK
jgi:hypothetical protein